MHEAFKELGFDPSGLGTEQDGKPKKEKSRKKTSGELATEGRTVEGAGDNSPHAHSQSTWTRCIVYIILTVYHEAKGRAISSPATPASLSAILPPRVRALTSSRAMGKASGKKGKGKKAQRGDYESTGRWGGWNLRGGRAFDNGMAAWQIFGREEYKYLRRTLGWRLDQWDRHRNISVWMTQILRHANSGGSSQPVQLAPDGTMSVATLLGFTGSRILGMTEVDIRRVCADRKQRVLVTTGPDGEARLNSAHGPSGLAHSMLNDALVMDEVAPGDEEWFDTLLHGTIYEHAPAIGRDGLFPGGRRGVSHRAHIHLVSQVDAHGEREGVRGGSNVLVQVDALAAYRHGARFFRSRTQKGVYLTAGLTEKYLCGGDFRERVIGLPKEFLLGVVDRVSGVDWR